MFNRKWWCPAVLASLTACVSTGQLTENEQNALVITEDIERFWTAYDAIRAEPDEHRHLDLLNALYIDRGTPGLHAMNRARSYRSVEYLEAIRNYPEYLDAVRHNTLMADTYQEEIRDALLDLQSIYPAARDVPIYFVIGAFRSGGTANDGKLLIGAELAMASNDAPTHEFGERMAHLPPYIASGPIDNLIDLNLHEYIHTQQRSTSGSDLLSQALFEGVAEYLSTEAIGRTSRQGSITYGQQNREDVFIAFEADIDSAGWEQWIWNSTDNPFGTRDLGYFVGYVVAKAYVDAATDKQAAIAHLIELDYQDRCAVAEVADQASVFSDRISRLRVTTDYSSCH